MDELTTPDFALRRSELDALSLYDVHAASPFAQSIAQASRTLGYVGYAVGGISSVICVAGGNTDIISMMWLFYLIMWLPLFYQQKRARNRSNITQTARRITIRAGGVLFESSPETIHIQWRGVSGVRRDKTNIYILLHGGSACAVPRRCFPSPSAEETFYRRALDLHNTSGDDNPDETAQDPWTEGRQPDVAYMLTKADIGPRERYVVENRLALSPAWITWVVIMTIGVALYAAFRLRQSLRTLDYTLVPQELAWLYCGAYSAYSMVTRRIRFMRRVRSVVDLPCRMWISPAHFIVHTPSQRRRRSWETVTRITSDDKFIYMHHRGSVRAIPQHAFESIAEFHQFADTIHRYHSEALREPVCEDVWPPAPLRP
ncbi:MAG: YcxB family protein [Capsulimonadaceae bacterium]